MGWGGAGVGVREGNMAKDRQLGAFSAWSGRLIRVGWMERVPRKEGAGLGIKIVRGKEFELSSGFVNSREWFLHVVL